MKPGDLLKKTCRINSTSSTILGILLDEPQFPRYGIYPKNYRILTPQGTVEIISDHLVYLIEVV
jgi:hypothetical protein